MESKRALFSNYDSVIFNQLKVSLKNCQSKNFVSLNLLKGAPKVLHNNSLILNELKGGFIL